jgi:hypothetical protein
MRPEPRKLTRCAVYTRVSTEYGLEQEFNSLDAQRESSEAYVKSQAHEGWRLLPTQYNDGGFSGGSLNRPALQKLLSDIRDRLVDNVVVFRRSSDGALLLVLMNGTQVQSATIFGQLGLEWTVHGVRDFNGDGKADIVFRRIADGAVFVLLMNGPGSDAIDHRPTRRRVEQLLRVSRGTLCEPQRDEMMSVARGRGHSA